MPETDDLADVALAAADQQDLVRVHLSDGYVDAPAMQRYFPGIADELNGHRRHLPILPAGDGPPLRAVETPRLVDPVTVAELAGFATIAGVDWFDQHARTAGDLEHAIAGVVHSAVASLLAAGVITVAEPPATDGCPALVTAGLDAVPEVMRYPGPVGDRLG